MAKSVDKLTTSLLAARDGRAAYKAIAALGEHARRGDAAAKRARGEGELPDVDRERLRPIALAYLRNVDWTSPCPDPLPIAHRAVR